MKRNILLGFAILMAVCVHAASFITDGIKYNVTSELLKRVEVVKPDGNEVYTGDIIIPSIVKNGDESYVVKRIATSAFENSEITSITLSGNVTVIQEYAFANCHNLTHVNFPEDGDYQEGETMIIGRNAFWNCSSLEEICLPELLRTIDTQTFYQCTALKNIIFPAFLREIGESAFKNCSSLNVILLPETVENIKTSAFAGCVMLKEIEIPEKTINFGYSIFENCTNLESVILPSALEKIPPYIFSDCINLVDICLPENISEIGNDAFRNCRSLIYLNIPSGLKKIGDSAYEGAANLEKISFKNATGLSIGNRTFAHCTSLERLYLYEVVNIGESSFMGCSHIKDIVGYECLESIGAMAFKNCGGIETISIWREEPPLVMNTSFDTTIEQTATLNVMFPYRNLYAQSPGWERFYHIEQISDAPEEPGSYVDKISNGEVSVSSNGEILIVRNAHGIITAYNLQGVKTAETLSKNGYAELPLPLSGIYIVRAEGKTYKFAR